MLRETTQPAAKAVTAECLCWLWQRCCCDAAQVLLSKGFGVPLCWVPFQRRQRHKVSTESFCWAFQILWQSAHAHPGYLQPLSQQGEYSFADTESLNVLNAVCSMGPLVVTLENPNFFVPSFASKNYPPHNLGVKAPLGLPVVFLQ